MRFRESANRFLSVGRDASAYLLTRLFNIIKPADPPEETYIQRSKAQRILGDLRSAEAIILQGLRKNPSSSKLATEIAEIASSKNDWTQAVSRWQSLLMAYGSDAPAKIYIRLCQAYRGLGDFAAAEAIIRRATTADPENEKLSMQFVALSAELAEIAAASANWQEALARWQMVLADRNAAPSQYWRSMVRTIDLAAEAEPLAALRLRRQLASKMLNYPGPAHQCDTLQTRIAYIPQSRMPSRAANNVHVMKMCNALAKSGIDVHLFAGTHHPHAVAPENIFSKFGCENHFPIFFVHDERSKDREQLLSVLAAIEKGCSHVLTRSLPAAYFAALAGKPTSLECHLPMSSSDHAVARDLFRLKTFKRLIVISHALKAKFIGDFPVITDRVDVVPDAADLPAPVFEKFVFLGAPCNDFRVGYAGQLYPGKGMEIIIEIAKRMPGIGFHVLGGYEEDIKFWKGKASTTKNIVFYGYRPQSEVAAFLKSVDVAIAPYSRDVSAHGQTRIIGEWMSPLKVFEYMSAGVPIVSSDLPVLREVLVHEKNALLCKPDDLQSWVSALKRLRADAGLRYALAARAKDEFEGRYTWEKRARCVVKPLLQNYL